MEKQVEIITIKPVIIRTSDDKNAPVRIPVNERVTVREDMAAELVEIGHAKYVNPPKTAKA